MEAEERPTKLRKLSHDQPRPETSSNPDPKNSTTASGTHESSDVPVKDEDTSNPQNSPFTAAQLSTASNAILTELPTANTPVDPSTEPSTTPGLSKNQLKKIKRKAEWEAGREDRKARRRAKDKEKKIRRRAERDEAKARRAQNQNGEHDDNDDGTKYRATNSSKWHKHNRIRLPITMVLDCSFDNLMTDGEIISLGSQLTRCYSDNSKTTYASHFYISSWTPGSELRKRFDGLMRGMYRNWKGITFIEEDFVEAGKLAHAAMIARSGGKMAGMFAKYAATTEPVAASQNENENGNVNGNKSEDDDGHVTSLLEADGTRHTSPTTTPSPPTNTNTNPTQNPPVPPSPLSTLQPPSQPQIIYLTSDSPHTLTTLSPYTTYIIGGLVDKNRHKSLCYNTAVRRGIPTAKLPIGEYMQMSSRQVLTTNHVVEIMLRWLEVGDWGDAFVKVLPKRKGARLRGKGGDESGSGSGEEDGDSEDEQGGEGNRYSDGDDDGDGDSNDIDINVTRDKGATKTADNEAAKDEVKI